MRVSLRQFEEALKLYGEQYDPCPTCLGVGCLPEHFGIGNGGKPCETCEGKGSILKQLDLDISDT